MRIAIVEDELVVGRKLLRTLRRILEDPDLEAPILSTLGESEAFAKENELDVVFLDLNLAGADGFELLERLAAAPFQTIVVSAHADRAVRAFEYGVVDFVAKPYTQERLAKAVGRLRERSPEERNRVRYVAVRDATGHRTIPLERVQFIEGAGDYSEIHCDDGTTHLHDKTLTRLESFLPDVFRRVHRSYIVHTGKLEGLRNEPGSRYFLRIKHGPEIPISRSRVREVRKWVA